MDFAMVAAADEELGIGKAGELPWKLPGDIAFFKRITSDTESAAARNAVIMGRKTWDTVPPRFRPLDGRLNVVVTRNAALPLPPDVLRAPSIAEALVAIAARDEAIEKVFVIGGGEIYALGMAMPGCRRIYLTRVEGRYGCDAHFPPIDPSFALTEQSARHEENGVGYVFQMWER
jgi:dihydrofolate reductase/thymidylate synthase